MRRDARSNRHNPTDSVVETDNPTFEVDGCDSVQSVDDPQDPVDSQSHPNTAAAKPLRHDWRQMLRGNLISVPRDADGGMSPLRAVPMYSFLLAANILVAVDFQLVWGPINFKAQVP
jgi:hypothetical protein